MFTVFVYINITQVHKHDSEKEMPLLTLSDFFYAK